MKEKARDLIYLDTKRYVSIDSLRVFYWASIIIPVMMIVAGIVAINANGLSWKSLFPILSIAIWSLFYWMFVLIIQSKKIEKTFHLRFLVNGISGVFVSSLFWILYTSFNLVADYPLAGFDFSLWLLFFYLLFSFLYIGLVAFGVHKGVFKKIKEKSQTPKALAISAFCAAILPSAGSLGMYISRVSRNHANESVQNVLITVVLVLIMFLPILAHINFVQYFYCKKYEIFCDEYGDTKSPNLEWQKKVKGIKAKSKDKNFENPDITNRKKTFSPRLIIKILFAIIALLIVFLIIVFLVLFLIAFIKGFIKGIS